MLSLAKFEGGLAIEVEGSGDTLLVGAVNYHRNGVGGTPFYEVRAELEGYEVVIVVASDAVDERYEPTPLAYEKVFVVNVREPEAGGWRGDVLAAAALEAIKAAGEQAGHIFKVGARLHEA